MEIMVHELKNVLETLKREIGYYQNLHQGDQYETLDMVCDDMIAALPAIEKVEFDGRPETEIWNSGADLRKREILIGVFGTTDEGTSLTATLKVYTDDTFVFYFNC